MFCQVVIDEQLGMFGLCHIPSMMVASIDGSPNGAGGVALPAGVDPFAVVRIADDRVLEDGGGVGRCGVT
jgi:hypothetical protein